MQRQQPSVQTLCTYEHVFHVPACMRAHFVCMNMHTCILHVRFLLVQENEAGVVGAAVAAVFIQDIDEIVYRVLLPAAVKAQIPEFHTPPYDNKYQPIMGLDESLRYPNVNGLALVSWVGLVGVFFNLSMKIPLIVGVSAAVVLTLRQDSRISCL